MTETYVIVWCQFCGHEEHGTVECNEEIGVFDEGGNQVDHAWCECVGVEW